MKKKFVLALSTLMMFSALSVSAFANDNISEDTQVENTTEYNDNEGEDMLPDGKARVTGSKTTGTIPKNKDGNQGTDVFTSTINNSDLDCDFYAEVSGFTNGMTSVNLGAYIGSECIGTFENMTSGSRLDFSIPSNAKGKQFKIKASTNSSKSGTCKLKVAKY